MDFKILLTGATSFTGAHIGRSLVDRGWEVWATLTQTLDETRNDPQRLARMEFSKIKNWVSNSSLGSPAFEKLLVENKFKVWINHGAPISGYRKMDFNYSKSALESLQGVEKNLKIFSQGGGGLLIHTGTIFEPNEGCETPGLEGASEALSPYGISKNWVWQATRFWAQKENVNTTKIIIPNPIGAFENQDRLLPVFAKSWKAGASLPTLRGGNLVRDNLPASWLAEVYADEVAIHLKSFGPTRQTRIRRPSGFVLKQKDFLEMAIKNFREINPKIKFDYKLDESPVDDVAERFNLEPVEELLKPHSQKEFWDDYSSYLLS